MSDRVSRCAADPAHGCFPLSWTLSPQTLHLAPAWLTWYYQQSYTTQHDWFMLPPSGDLYSYPGAMPEDVQAQFVANTELDCQVRSPSYPSVCLPCAPFLSHAASAAPPPFPPPAASPSLLLCS